METFFCSSFVVFISYDSLEKFACTSTEKRNMASSFLPFWVDVRDFCINFNGGTDENSNKGGMLKFRGEEGR